MAMNQVIGIALKALGEYKKIIDEVKDQIEVARHLARCVEILEVTVMMIPTRGNEEEMKKMISLSGGNTENNEEMSSSPNGESSLEGIVPPTVEQVKTNAHEISKYTSLVRRAPFSKKVEKYLEYFVPDQETIINDVRPAEILSQMRKRGESDLEISFTAMRFLIHSCLEVIKSAVADISKLAVPSITMYLMPWKLMAQKEAGDALEGHIEALNKLNLQLQNTVSIASYCISLEQLENVLDATSVLTNRTMREFWKKKIGISNVKVKMETLIETFLNHIRKDILQNKIKNFHLREKLVNIRDIPEVALGRFVSHLFNTNGDDWLTVFELNGNTEKYGKDEDVIKVTFEKIRELEQHFCSKIEFIPLNFQKPGKTGQAEDGSDHSSGTNSTYNIQELLARNVSKQAGTYLHSNDIVLTVQPFQRLTILCKVPQFNKNLYPHDCITLLRYEGVAELNDLHTASIPEFTFREIDNCRSYLSEVGNMEFYRRDLYAWNAPDCLQRKQSQKVEIQVDDTLTLGQNFKETKLGGDVSRDLDGATSLNRGPHRIDHMLGEHGVGSMCTMLYTPIIRKPGFYTVRLALDDLKIDTNDEVHSTVFKKKMSISNKNYYYNRSVEERDLFTSVRGSMIMASIEGLGMLNFKQYLTLMLQLYDLDIEEQFVLIEHNTFCADQTHASHSFGDNRQSYDAINIIEKEKAKFIKSNTMKVNDYEIKKNGNTSPSTNPQEDVSKQNESLPGESSPATPTVAAEAGGQHHHNLFRSIKTILQIKHVKKHSNTEKGEDLDDGDVEEEARDDNKISAVSLPRPLVSSKEGNRNADGTVMQREAMSKALLLPERLLVLSKDGNRNVDVTVMQTEAMAKDVMHNGVLNDDKVVEYAKEYENSHDTVTYQVNPMSLSKKNSMVEQTIIKLVDQVQRHIVDLELFESLDTASQKSNDEEVLPLVKEVTHEHRFDPHSCMIHQSRKILGTLPMNLLYQYGQQIKLVIEHDMNKTKGLIKQEAEHQFKYKCLILRKILLLFDWTKLIIQTEKFINLSVKGWRNRLPFTNSILQQIENSLKEYKGLVAEHRVLKETVLKMIQKSPPSLLISPKRTALLLKLDNDTSTSLAMDALIFEKQTKLFHQFYVVKISLYALDASEAVVGCDISRVMELQKKMQSLNDLVVAVDKDHGYQFPVVNFIMNTADRQRKQQKQESSYARYYEGRFESREEAIQNIKVFVKNVTSFINQLEHQLTIEEQRCQTVGYSAEWRSLRNRIDKCLVIANEFEEHLKNANCFSPMTAELDDAPLLDVVLKPNQDHNTSAFGHGHCYTGASITSSDEIDSKNLFLENQPLVSFGVLDEKVFVQYVKLQFEVFYCEMQRLLKYSDNCEPQALLKALSLSENPSNTDDNTIVLVTSIRSLIHQEGKFIKHVKKETESFSSESKKDFQAALERVELHIAAVEGLKARSPNLLEETFSSKDENVVTSMIVIDDLPKKSKSHVEVKNSETKSPTNKNKRKSVTKILKSFKSSSKTDPIPSSENGKEVERKDEIQDEIASPTSSEYVFSSIPQEIRAIIEVIRVKYDTEMYGQWPPSKSNRSPTMKHLFLVLTLLPRYHFLSFLEEIELEIKSLKLVEEERRNSKNISPLETALPKSMTQSRRLSFAMRKSVNLSEKITEHSEFANLYLHPTEIKRLERIMLVLKQILAIYELSTVIVKLDEMIKTKLHTWHVELPALNQELLAQVQTAVSDKKSLIVQHSQLIRSTYQQLDRLTLLPPPMYVMDHGNMKKDAAYLVHLSNGHDDQMHTGLGGQQQDSTGMVENKKMLTTKDIDRIARDALGGENVPSDAFFRYFVLKSYIYSVDAFESCQIHDWRRLSELENNVNALNDLLIKFHIKREKEAPAKNAHDNRVRLRNILSDTSMFNADETFVSLPTMSSTTGSTASTTTPRLFNDYKRSTVLIHVKRFLSFLQQILRNVKVTDESSKTNVQSNMEISQSQQATEDALGQRVAFTKQFDQIQELISHFNDIAERVETTSPPTPWLLATAVSLQQKKLKQQQALALKNVAEENSNDLSLNSQVIKPHGLIIHVERKNAMIWGQAIIHSGTDASHTNVPSVFLGAVGNNVSFQTYYKKRVTSSQATTATSMPMDASSGNDKQVVNWRPWVDLHYPYANKRVLDIPEELIKEVPLTPINKLRSQSTDGANHRTIETHASGTAESQPENHSIFAIFHYTFKHSGPSVEAKIQNDGKEQMRICCSTPTHVAFFPLNKSFNCNKDDLSKVTVKDLDISKGMTGNPCELSKNAKYTEIDFNHVFADVHFAMNDNDEVRETYFLVFVSKLEKYEYIETQNKSRKRFTKVYDEYVVVENSPLLQLNVHESRAFQNEDGNVENTTRRDDGDGDGDGVEEKAVEHTDEDSVDGEDMSDGTN